MGQKPITGSNPVISASKLSSYERVTRVPVTRYLFVRGFAAALSKIIIRLQAE
jgi:hypothetical protein